MKLLVVPERVGAVHDDDVGRRAASTPGLSAAIAGSFHFLILPRKILASVVPLSWSLSTPLRLYDTVIGAATVGK